MSIKILLIDDEQQSLELLAMYIAEDADLKVVGMETKSQLAYDKVRNKEILPDVIFLDINMPVLDGFSFMDLIEDLSIPVVLTSAHKNYGPESYNYDVVDYLEKVIVKKRFSKCIEKVRNRLKLSNDIKTGIDAGMLTIPGDGKYGYKYLKLEEILYIQANNTYVNVHTQKGQYLTNYSMKRIDQLLSSKHFLRVHNSYIVNLRQMTESGWDTIILSNKKEIPLSESYRDKFYKAIRPD